ncbi:MULTISPECIES: elongation factor P maturation arginine rhamnosyltransferase EarP [Nitrosomonas]|uniref:elongation factor P maturation arginine rhamnosyltransferase EarP n=1 Tax=Nitrosomonas TaxID=914 RepID=UPI001936EDBA|nr:MULTISPECIES: elongation factor P maturation arginine rhamnosyltransferase EarP [Nitrosomonas]MBV6388711.1 hypothetical protein [Nitrosomonas europaea]QOJ08847.1 MAG: elongation factor P maturation arginine rhamnosyltransferase EarP [Nitrosomonas sp. H1_AOB3]
MRWDIFCHVVDNYGDIGICWRLARQLVTEFDISVRMLVDDLGAMQRICPAIDPRLAVQNIRGVEILHWVESFADLVPANVVIEAFGCELPPRYVAAMAAASPRFSEPEGKTDRIWINLEYLSAEQWVEGCHGLASPHPSLPLIKYFFFPGFTAETGGLLREAELFALRDASRTDPAGLWRKLGITNPAADEATVSLFCYDSAPISDLLEAWAGSISPVRCLLPEGTASASAASWAGISRLAAGDSIQRGNLILHVIPFMSQENYDHLLWACDCNFVRGEDSFVRAQWSARPIIWQIYPQQENVHLIKLEAFLDLYCQGLAEPAADAVRAFHRNWNNNEQPDWNRFWQYRDVLQQHAIAWAERLAQIPDLASNLVNFCRNR